MHKLKKPFGHINVTARTAKNIDLIGIQQDDAVRKVRTRGNLRDAGGNGVAILLKFGAFVDFILPEDALVVEFAFFYFGEIVNGKG